MFIGTEEEHLELKEVERVTDDLPTRGDVRLEVSVRLRDFSGRTPSVWLDRAALERFVEELRELVETRKSAAKIEAMSPGEFSVELRPNGPVGHFEMAVVLGRGWYGAQQTHWITQVSGGLDVDPSELPVILRAFEAMIASRHIGS